MPARTKKERKSAKRGTMKRTAPKRAMQKQSAPKRVVSGNGAQKKAAAQAPRFTYSNLTFSEQDHGTYDAAIGHFQEQLGEHYKNLVNGVWVDAQGGHEQAHASPADTRIVVSYFPRFGRAETVEAIRAARLAANEWNRTRPTPPRR